MLISMVIPSYNRANTVGQTIDFILQLQLMQILKLSSEMIARQTM